MQIQKSTQKLRGQASLTKVGSMAHPRGRSTDPQGVTDDQKVNGVPERGECTFVPVPVPGKCSEWKPQDQEPCSSNEAPVFHKGGGQEGFKYVLVGSGQKRVHAKPTCDALIPKRRRLRAVTREYAAAARFQECGVCHEVRA